MMPSQMMLQNLLQWANQFNTKDKRSQQTDSTPPVQPRAEMPPIRTLGGTEMPSDTGRKMDTPVSMDSPQAKVNPESGKSSDMASGIGGVLGGISDNFTAPPIWTPPPAFDGYGGIGDAYIQKAASGGLLGMKMFRRGGRLLPGEEGIVAEDTKHPEHIYNNDGVVEVTPLKPPVGQAEPYGLDQTIRQDDTSSAVNNLARIGELARLGIRAPADREPIADVGEGAQRAQIPTESLLQSVQNNADEDTHLPPRQSYIDTARIIAENARGANPNDPGLLDARESVLKEQLWKELNTPIKKSKWKDLGAKLILATNNAVNNENRPVIGWEEAKRNKRLGELMPKLAMIQQQKKAQQEQIDKDTENKLKLKRIEDYDRDEQFRRDQLAQGALKQIVGLKHFDPNNPIHVQRAKQAGIDPADLQGWDDRNPFTKKIGGREYVWDTEAKVFKPVNVPDNELVDYNVETLKPDGTKEIKTYKVPKIDAARFATQWGILGAQAEIADKRQTKQQEFQKGENEKNRTLQKTLQDNAQKFGREEATQMVKDKFKELFLKENGRNPTQAEIDEYMNTKIEPIFNASGEAIPNQ